MRGRAAGFAIAGALAVAAATALVLHLPGDDAVTVGPGRVGPTLLSGAFAPDDRLAACEACHFAWETPFELHASRTDGGNASAYRVALRVGSGYDLAATFAAPRFPQAPLPPPAVADVAVTVNGATDGVLVPFDLPWPTAAVLAEAWGAYSYERPEVLSELVPASPPPGALSSVAGNGSRANKVALYVAPDGAPLEGRVALRVRIVDAQDAAKPVLVRFRAFPVGYVVHPRVEYGTPAAFEWALPPPGAPGAPSSFHVATVPFNDHPTTKFAVTVAADKAWFEGEVDAVAAAAPASPRNWTAEDLDAPWSGGDALVLHEYDFDGVRVRSVNERGEWSRYRVDATEGASDRAVAEVPPPERALPAIPPGTTHVRVTLSWVKRTPISPDPTWVVATTRRPLPDFKYPEPASLEEGQAVFILPVAPEEWETTPTGWFQAHAVLDVGAEGRAAFDGTYRLVVEAVRERG